MSANPYTPPKAEIADQPTPPGSPKKAIAVALAIDIGGTLLIGLILGFLYGVSLARAGWNQAEIGEAMKSIPIGHWVSVTGMLVGTALSGISGYVCARISRSTTYKLPLILAAITVAFGVLVSYNIYPVWLNSLLSVATFIAVLAGASAGKDKGEF